MSIDLNPYGDYPQMLITDIDEHHTRIDYAHTDVNRIILLNRELVEVNAKLAEAKLEIKELGERLYNIEGPCLTEYEQDE